MSSLSSSWLHPWRRALAAEEEETVGMGESRWEARSLARLMRGPERLKIIMIKNA
jgi:hypothetical protein